MSRFLLFLDIAEPTKKTHWAEGAPKFWQYD